MRKVYFYMLFFSIALTSCLDSSDDVSPPQTVDYFKEDVIDLFKNVALGFELGLSSKVTRRWESEIKLFINGRDSLPEDYIREIYKVAEEISKLAASNVFQYTITEDESQANATIYIGSRESYPYNVLPSGVYDALFYVSRRGDVIYKAETFVDVNRHPTIVKHHIREELTQIIGLGRDTPDYHFRNSIFYQNYSETTAFSNEDKEVIRLLYHPSMQLGLDETQVDAVLREILGMPSKVTGGAL